MDKRTRPLLWEILIVTGLFILLTQAKVLPTNPTHPLTIFALIILLAECVRFLYKMRALRKNNLTQ